MVSRTLPTGTVTLLFTDIEGSTRLLDDLGSDYGEVLATHHALLREAWRRHDGTEVDNEGDAFFVAFATAPAAVAAAENAQRSLAEHTWPGGHRVRVRMGIHTGTPAQREFGYWGHDVHYAARLAAAAHGGQILLSEVTHALVPEADVDALGEHTLKDFPVPREIFHLRVDGIGAGAFPPARTATPDPRHGLPTPATELIGRADDLAGLEQRVEDTRLVTITGPGGSGKTRLMLELGHRLAGTVDRVCFVALESVASPDGVAAAVTAALGLPDLPGTPPLDRAVTHLRDRHVLLLLDNAEHVIDAAPDLAHLAAAGPDVRIVVTSQLPLHVAGESVLRLGQLPTPVEVDDLDEMAAVPAVALLLRRAEAAGWPFTLTAANATDVARLCEQLEGMPLALELAAGRLGLTDVAALTDRVERRLDALGTGARDLPARQRGLRAVLEWSCGVLADDHRDLLGGLSVLVGGFTAELAEAAFDADLDVLDGLAALRDAALIRVDRRGRFTVRPPVRRYAADTLLTPETEARAYRGVAAAVAAAAEVFERRWMLVEGEGRLVIDPDTANIFAVLEWTSTHDLDLHARLSAATGWWARAVHRTFGLRHVTEALERVEDPTMRARLLQAAGALGLAEADPTACLEAADAWRALGDVGGEVTSLLYGANLIDHQGTGTSSLPLVERAAEVVRHEGGDADLKWLVEVSRLASFTGAGRADEAVAMAGPLLAAPTPGSWRDFWVSTLVADAELKRGHPLAALPLYARAMRVVRTFSTMRTGEVIQADTIAQALAEVGRHEDAALTLAVAEMGHAELSWPPRGILARALQRTRTTLSDELIADGREQARALGLTAGLLRVAELASR